MGQFWRVSLVHAGIVLAMLLASVTGWIFEREDPIVVPVEFTVEVPAGEVDETDIPDEPEVASFAPEPAPDAIPEPKAEKPLEKKPEKKPIQRSTKKVTRKSPDGKPKASGLSEEEIRRLLALGATPSDHTSIPDEDARCFELVRRTLYELWAQPAAEDVGGATAEGEIRLLSDGRVVGRNLRKASGSAAMDQSVLDALETARRIEGLTPEFIARHPTVSVRFRVE
jgi:TonB family protein